MKSIPLWLSIVLVSIGVAFLSGGIYAAALPSLPSRGKLLEIGIISPAWGGQRHIVCSNGDLFTHFGGEQAGYQGSIGIGARKGMQAWLGNRSIDFREDVTVPDTFDADHSEILRYQAKEPARVYTGKNFLFDYAKIGALFALQRPPVDVTIDQTLPVSEVYDWPYSQVLALKDFKPKNNYDFSVSLDQLTPAQFNAIQKARAFPRKDDFDHEVFFREEGKIYRVALRDEWSDKTLKSIEIKPMTNMLDFSALEKLVNIEKVMKVGVHEGYPRELTRVDEEVSKSWPTALHPKPEERLRYTTIFVNNNKSYLAQLEIQFAPKMVDAKEVCETKFGQR